MLNRAYLDNMHTECVYIYIYILVGGLEHFLFSPIVGMMIQSD